MGEATLVEATMRVSEGGRGIRAGVGEGVGAPTRVSSS